MIIIIVSTMIILTFVLSPTLPANAYNYNANYDDGDQQQEHRCNYNDQCHGIPALPPR